LTDGGGHFAVRYDLRLNRWQPISVAKITVSKKGKGAAAGPVAGADGPPVTGSDVALRTGHCVAAAAGRLLVFGGLGNDGTQLLNDVWAVDLM
jgi:hypothetical protein